MPRPKKDKTEMGIGLIDFLIKHGSDITEEEYNSYWSKPCHSRTLRKLFGSWKMAKEFAQVKIEQRRDVENEIIGNEVCRNTDSGKGKEEL